MKSTSESGHAKNVANFDDLILFINGYGAAYNPSKASIKPASLLALAANAKTMLAAVNSALAGYGNAVSAREVAFDPLSKLVTRVVNALKATDATDQVNDHARSLANKLQGKRASPKKTEEEKKTLEAAGITVKEVSASQMSYDNRMDNLDKLIKLLSVVPLYAPNEAELKVAALTALYTDLKTKNAAVATAYTALSNARIARNDVMYKPQTGLVDIAQDAKNYIKSVFGTSSAQYKQISSLEFKTALQS